MTRSGRPLIGPVLAGAAALALAASPAPAQQAADHDHLQLSAGWFQPVDDDGDEAADFGAQYRPAVRALGGRRGDVWNGLGPAVGARVNSDGGALLHAGLFVDLRPFDRAVIWAGSGPAAWVEGGSRDLGGTFQFMTEVYAGYRLDWGDQIGVSWQHVSNAGLHEENPGADTVMLSYTVAFGPLF